MAMIEEYNMHSAPAWLKTVLLLTLSYISYRAWSWILRTRREQQTASWILNQRRRAGIPDSDKRPFKIAKAAVLESNSKKINGNGGAHKHHRSPTRSPPLPLKRINPLQKTISTLKPPSPLEDSPDHPLAEHNTLHLPNHTRKLHRIEQPDQIHLTTNSHTSEPQSHPSLVTSSTSSLHPVPSSDTLNKTQPNRTPTDKLHQKRVAPISSDGSDSDQSETEAERAASRNRKKARTTHSHINSAELTTIDSTNSNDSSHPTGFKDVLRKKRILSDCVSELDEDHTARVKKGRSEKIQREEEADDDSDLGSTPEVNEEDQMRVDQEDGISQDEEEEEEEEEEEKEDGQKQALDEELYIIADDGQKKKLVKIRLGSPESVDSNEQDSNIEQRWVTHKEFRKLKQNQQLLLDDDGWDSESVLSSSDSLDGDTKRQSTPLKQSAERGPIWSIEGKARLHAMLPATEVPMRIRTASRPRNSLGRMRLSLPPAPASPSQLTRSRLVSPFRPCMS
ncbi:hypothetical protein PCASD_13009 [Puccinia coronata f. sp. avenae]|uniref:Uncharacterized protein n=1 Tax=Puccinia coronata f. sp. avenae TaxID=200324 RepID=A0A2N5UBH9_9BASI|nr:hypothetical protein PCASD_13009 [Puccinia coronata f. sp. avenae]